VFGKSFAGKNFVTRLTNKIRFLQQNEMILKGWTILFEQDMMVRKITDVKT